MMKRQALGRGVEALLPKKPYNSSTNNLVVNLNISDIKPDIDQPRKTFNDESITELSRSIKEKGILQPIVVRKIDTGYSIIAGERRWRASKLISLAKIPALIKNVDISEGLEISLIENIQREDLNPIEQAQGFKKLIEVCGYSQEKLSEKVGKKRSTIANSLRLLKLPEAVQVFVKKGILSNGHARSLLALDNEIDISNASEVVIKKAMSVRDCEKFVSSLLKKSKNKPKLTNDKNKLSIEYTNVKESLQRSLGTKVQIKPGKKDSGKIIIDYFSIDDFNRLINFIENK